MFKGCEHRLNPRLFIVGAGDARDICLHVLYGTGRRLRARAVQVKTPGLRGLLGGLAERS